MADGEDKPREGRAFVVSGSSASLSTKAFAMTGQVESYIADDEDQLFSAIKSRAGEQSIEVPPISPIKLTEIVHENNAVEPCISAYESNVSGTGYELVASDGTAEADLTDEMKEERDALYERLEEVDAGVSLTALRRALRRDLHTTGNRYLLIERTAQGEIAFLRRAPAKSMRLATLDPSATVRLELSGERAFTTNRAERRFVQALAHNQHVWFKQYGSQRALNKDTGAWATSLPYGQRAHEILWDWDREDAKTPYGVPLWITQLPSVLGSRLAEEQNLGYFESGGIPPAMIFISGGHVSEELQQAITSFLRRPSGDKFRVGVFEVPGSGDIDGERPATITVKEFGVGASADSAFENYDEKCERRVRRAFRLPAIFVGMTDSYNFATAQAAVQVAEDQVFGPERKLEDAWLNSTIIRELTDGRWKLRSHPISIRDAALQLMSLKDLGTLRGADRTAIIRETARVGGVDVDVAEDMAGDNFVGGEADQAQLPQPGNDNKPKASGQARAVALSVKLAAEKLGLDDEATREAAVELLTLKSRYEALDDEDRVAVGQALKANLATFSLGAADLRATSPLAFMDGLFSYAESLKG